MSQPVKRPRAYDSPRRRDQARATRRAVLDGARALFVEKGYVGTTIDAIAAAAGVSPETVYAAFGSKRTVLAELVDVSIAGGDEARPILDQAWVEEMRAELDPRRRLVILAEHGQAILERRAAVDAVVRGAAAADPDLAALWERGKSERFTGQRELLRIAVGPSGLRADLGLDAAADILYAIGSPETYRSLVVDRRWSGAHFASWYADVLARMLLDPAD